MLDCCFENIIKNLVGNVYITDIDMVNHYINYKSDSSTFFAGNNAIKEFAKEVDLKDLMLETDCPYLAPHPFRGMENSPKYIGFVAKEIAKIGRRSLSKR